MHTIQSNALDTQQPWQQHTTIAAGCWHVTHNDYATASNQRSSVSVQAASFLASTSSKVLALTNSNATNQHANDAKHLK
jgi:hypothetical protein